jgi:heterodisulfide reductase subunit C
MRGKIMNQMEGIEMEQGTEALSVPVVDQLAKIREMVSACIQCGTCTGSCPNAFAMDLTPRRLWYHVLMGEKEIIFASRTFSLCSACYYCMLRCPRGLPLTEAMSALKQLAAKEDLPLYKKSIRFYESFLQSVRRNGRVKEMAFMTRYLLSLKNPLTPFSFAPLGMKLMGKGKVSFEILARGNPELEVVFRKVADMEKNEAP